MSEKRTPDSKLSASQILQSKLDSDLYEIRVLVRLCQMCDNGCDENERGYVLFLHDIIIEKIDKLEDLVLEVAVQ